MKELCLDSNDKIKEIFLKWFGCRELFSEVDCQYLLNESDRVGVNYLRNTIGYYKEYFNSLIDISMTYNDGRGAVFYLPLFFHESSDGYSISTDGVKIFFPLFSAKLDRIKKKEYLYKIFCFISEFADIYGVSDINFVDSIGESGSWADFVLDSSCKDTVRYEYVVNLNENLDFIKSNFRRRYKTLINKSMNLWVFDIYDGCDDALIEDFREFHYKVSGRRTRSKESWILQQKQVNSGEGFIIKVSDLFGNMVGISLFLYSKSEGIYAVGVYDRSLFDQPIGHGVQWVAIKKLKELGVKNYIIGEFHPSWQRDGITEKELNIENFKRGFATDIRAKLAWQVSL